MAESRFERWARKKSEASRKVEPTAPATTVAEPSTEEQELAVNESLTEQEVLEKYGLPDPDAIELGTDITGFMRKEIPELLRRRALRSLWRSNPVLAVLDGLNDYDEDFTNAGTAVGGVKTLYKVGQGLIDRTRKVAEQADELLGEPAGAQDTAEPDAVTGGREPGTPVASLPDVRISDAGISTPKTEETEVARVQAREPEAEPTPRHRPRMRFDH